LYSFIFITLGKTLAFVKKWCRNSKMRSKRAINVIIKHCMLLLCWLRKAV